MSCEEIAEKLVEKARWQMEPGAALRTHLRSCAACRDRWDAQENLTAHLKAIRFSAWEQRSPDSSREMLMARFAQRRRVHAIPRWSWALAAAAALVISIVTVPILARRVAMPGAGVGPNAALLHNLASTDSSAWSSDATDVQSDAPADPESEGFMAVPFVPPLATGELLHVVHTELNPGALESLGVNVDPAWTAQLPADLLLGEDGMPRAVRVSDAMSGSGGF